MATRDALKHLSRLPSLHPLLFFFTSSVASVAVRILLIARLPFFSVRVSCLHLRAKTLRQVLDKQRLYFKAVQTFQQECKRNEALRATVEQQQAHVPTPPAAPPPAALAGDVASAIPDL